MPISTLTRLVYASQVRAAREPMLEGDLLDILAVAGPNNKRLEVSGLLIAHRGWFIQALEGSAKAVEQLYDRICLDRRHATPAIITHGPAARRMFEQWSMSAWNLSPTDAAIDQALAALPSFDPRELPPHQVMALLTEVARVHEAKLNAKLATASAAAAA